MSFSRTHKYKLSICGKVHASVRAKVFKIKIKDTLGILYPKNFFEILLFYFEGSFSIVVFFSLDVTMFFCVEITTLFLQSGVTFVFENRCLLEDSVHFLVFMAGDWFILIVILVPHLINTLYFIF